MYFQPPFCKSVDTKVGKAFLRIVKNTFTKDHPLYKILKPDNLKLSYSCLPNVKQDINSHNNKLLKSDRNNETTANKNCSCTKNRECPLNKNCKQENVVYKATITSKEEEKIYVGSTGNSFKSRYNQHTHTLKNRNANQTAFSKYVWKLKDKNIQYKIKWEIIQKTRPPTTVKKGCNLCNLERLEIAKADKNKALNKRNELKTQCPHYRNRFFNTKKPKEKQP